MMVHSVILECGRRRNECCDEFKASLGHIEKQGLQSQNQKANKQANITTSNKAALMFHGALSVQPHHSCGALLNTGCV